KVNGKRYTANCQYLCGHVFAFNTVTTCAGTYKLAVAVSCVDCQSVILQFNSKSCRSYCSNYLVDPFFQFVETLYLVKTVQSFDVLVSYKSRKRFAAHTFSGTVIQNLPC